MTIKSSSISSCPCPPNILFIQQISSALFYALCSGLITIVNKLVLTSYGFPSFQVLAIGQLIISIIVLYLARTWNLIQFPPFSKDTLHKIMPLPLLFFGNLLFGLGGTKAVSLPMFTALRRFSIWMTMIAEQMILGIKQPFISQASVYLMVIGALIASGDDLTFNIFGYGFLTANNIFTAIQGVVMKQKLLNKDFNQNGLLFYNSILILGPMIILTIVTEDLDKLIGYDHYLDVGFLSAFFLSSLMGFLLNYSSMLCTNYNSPLTTAVVGACKNLFVTYAGIFIGGDYLYSLINFIGINISAIGSVAYSWVTFTSKPPTKSSSVIVIPEKVKDE